MSTPTDKSRLDEIVREIAALPQDKPDLPAREVLGISPRTAQDYAKIETEVDVRSAIVTGALAYWRGRCDHLLAMRGEHGSEDFRRRRVAVEAWRLLKLYNNEPASGTADSLYEKVASLLWEAATGERHRDLQRACKDALTTLPTPHQPS